MYTINTNLPPIQPQTTVSPPSIITLPPHITTVPSTIIFKKKNCYLKRLFFAATSSDVEGGSQWAIVAPQGDFPAALVL